MDKKTGEAFFAITIGSIEMLKEALEAGADIKSRDRYGNTMLVAATEENFMEFDSFPPMVLDDCIKAYSYEKERFAIMAMRLLLVKGADVNEKNWSNGETALHKAVFVGSLTAIKLLIDSGADVNAEDFQGWTALDYCFNFDNIQAARILLNNGAQSEKNSEHDYEHQISTNMKSVLDEFGSNLRKN